MNKTYVIPEYEHQEEEIITFSRSELAPNDELKSNSIVLEVGMTMKNIKRYRVKRILVDIGASRNILYYRCFKEMGLSDHHLKPSSIVLEGFTTHKIQVKGTVRLKVTLGVGETTRTEEIKFYVVDIDSSYNAILGTPFHA